MIFKEISEEDREKINAYFDRDPSVASLQNLGLRRTKLLKRPDAKGFSGNVERGGRIAENISVHWELETTQVRFEQSGRDLEFRFSKYVGDYFSISWALEADEIEMLNPNLLISLSVEKIRKMSGSRVPAPVHGRLSYVKGNQMRIFECAGDKMAGRRLVGFSLNKPEIAFDQAYRLWVDFIISQPRTRSLVLHDPYLAFQDRILL